MRSPACLVATGFGIGLSPVAPGTCGALLAVPIFVLCRDWPLAAWLGLTALVCALGWICADICARRLGRDDPREVVIDETAGAMLSFAALPAKSWWWLAFVFVLFRVFDIVKPWPVGLIDRAVHGGAGIMLDDLAAAAYAALALWATAFALEAFA